MPVLQFFEAKVYEGSGKIWGVRAIQLCGKLMIECTQRRMREDYDQILCYGISFFKKRRNGKRKSDSLQNKTKAAENSRNMLPKTVHGGRTGEE